MAKAIAVAVFMSLLAGCSTAPIKLVTYDPEIRWDHDQLRICRFTNQDKRLDCLNKQNAGAALKAWIEELQKLSPDELKRRLEQDQ